MAERPAARRPGLALILGLCLALAGAEARALPMPRTALYAVVRSCVLAWDTFGRPFPCLTVDPAGTAARSAVLRAPGRSTHVILVPTARVPGIEDPQLRSPPYGSLWPAALAARRFVREGAGAPVPPAAVALGVNADVTRSQDQLHIHAECLRPNLLAALRAAREKLGPDWRALPQPFGGNRFQARLTSEAALAQENLFVSLARMPGTGGRLSGVTALVVAADAGGGGTLIALASTTRRRSIEGLFDPDCCATRRVARAG